MASTRPSTPPLRVRNHPGPTKVRLARGLRVHHAESLSREAEEMLFACAEILTEGRVGEGRFFGSTMITFDLAALASLVRGLDGRAAEEALHRIASGSVRVRLRVMRIACAEARRRAPELAFGTMFVDTRMRYAPGRLYVDVDVEAPVESIVEEDVW